MKIKEETQEGGAARVWLLQFVVGRYNLFATGGYVVCMSFSLLSHDFCKQL
jgi:hypothetical protein